LEDNMTLTLSRASRLARHAIAGIGHGAHLIGANRSPRRAASGVESRRSPVEVRLGTRC
jgi:hypothetical protein